MDKQLENKETETKPELYTLLVAVFCSCATEVDPYSNYCESEIVEKSEALVGKWFKFRHEGKITV